MGKTNVFGDRWSGSRDGAWVALVFGLLTAALAYAVTLGTMAMALALAVAVLVVVLVLLGTTRIAILMLALAFATSPMNKGISPGGPDSPLTPTDLMFGLGVLLLLPTLLRRKLELPLAYIVGIVLIVVTGSLSTAFATDKVTSAIQFVQWLMAIVGLLGLFAWWAPSWKLVDGLLWSYVAGQVVSTAYAPLGGVVGDRWEGLSHHPNEFGGAGVMGFAALMYLWRRHDAVWYRVLVAGAGAVCGVAVVMSGSRAAAAVLAGLVLMIPFVERSAVKGFLLAVGGALALLAIPLVVPRSGQGTAIARLAGSADALGADQARSQAQSFGFDLFFHSPIIGNGFAQALFVHDVVLGVASSVGVIGLLGYLMVLYTLARPIIGSHPNRRLAYVAWAFIAITPTFPALDDRTLWVPMAPVILLAIQSGRQARQTEQVGQAGRTSRGLPARQPAAGALSPGSA